MSDNIKTTLYLPPTLSKQIETTCAAYQYKSKNEFMVEALRAHIATVTLQNTDDIFIEKMQNALDKHTKSLSERLSKGLYRYAIEVDMLMHILAAISQITNEEIDALRGRAIRDVKKNRGRLSLEAVADFQSDGETRRANDRIEG